jgi:hypothetical protein
VIRRRKRRRSPRGRGCSTRGEDRCGTGETLPGGLRQAKTVGIRQEPKAEGAGRESEGFIVSVKSGKLDGGKEPCIG